ncbi:hypothetical protein ACI8AF_13320 [Blastococcus sp. SYSU D00669]
MDLVFLHGPPASGKLTTARALERLVGYPVFHNHLVVDLLTGIFPFGTPPFVRLREEFWTAVFAEAAAAGRSLVFTFAPEATVRAGFAERARAAVEEAGGRVRFVRLLVGAEEQRRRVVLPDRGEFHKLRDPGLLRGAPAADQPPADLEIDTDVSDPAASAARIVEHFALRPQPAAPRYP